MSRIRTLAKLSVAAIAALAATAPGAQAATTCAYEPDNSALRVQMSADLDHARLAVVGTTIVVSERSQEVPCSGGSPSTHDIDTVLVLDNSPGGSTFVEIARPAEFAPGRTLETNGSEIEFGLVPGSGDGDVLRVSGSEAAETWTLGKSGLNLNTDFDGAAPDSELGFAPTVFDRIILAPGAGDDRVDAQGGAGTGLPFTGQRLEIHGGTGADRLSGGEGVNELIGGDAGPDVIRAFGGDDIVDGMEGDDTIDGGDGEDFASFFDAPNGATVDLGRSGPQDTGYGVDTLVAIEHLGGSEASDTLIGDERRNVLEGGEGNDRLDGRGGDDVLHGGAEVDTVAYDEAPAAVDVDLGAAKASGGAGADEIFDVENVVGSRFADTLAGSAAANAIDARDGERDTVACADERDEVTADRRGVDAIAADCETVAFLPGPLGQLPGDGAPPAAGAADRSLVLRLSRARLRPRAVVVKASCANEACSLVARARGRKPRLRLGALRKRVRAGATKTLRLRLSRAQRRAVRRALAAGRRPQAKVTVRATDAAGNTVTRTVTARRAKR